MTPLREGAIRRAGLDPDKVLYQTAEIADQRDPSRWMPLALSSIYGILTAVYTKAPKNVPDILRMWGLTADADRLDALAKMGKDVTTDRAITSFFGAKGK